MQITPKKLCDVLMQLEKQYSGRAVQRNDIYARRQVTAYFVRQDLQKKKKQIQIPYVPLSLTSIELTDLVKEEISKRNKKAKIKTSGTEIINYGTSEASVKSYLDTIACDTGRILGMQISYMTRDAKTRPRMGMARY